MLKEWVYDLQKQKSNHLYNYDCVVDSISLFHQFVKLYFQDAQLLSFLLFYFNFLSPFQLYQVVNQERLKIRRKVLQDFY